MSTYTTEKMNRFIIAIVLLICGELSTKAQISNPWLDSSQINHSKAPLCIANGVVVNLTELNVDFITSMNVVSDKKANQKWGQLADNGCIYVEADQRFDVITPRLYEEKKKLPPFIRAVVYMLNGTITSDTLQISKASIRRVDVLLGSTHTGVPADSACLSIWTLSNEERGLPKPKNEIRIRGDKTGE
jgi:hypothetical protein